MANKVQSMINAALASGSTPTERLQAFLNLNPAGLPGVANLHERQERLMAKLDIKITYHPAGDLKRIITVIGLKKSKPTQPESWVPRSRWFTDSQRDDRRAHRTGDATLALSMAESYHEHVSSLYTSDKASIVYGHATNPEVDWHYYAKSYNHPARWTNAACCVSYDPAPTLHLFTARNREIAIPMPPMAATTRGLLDGDLYSLPREINGMQVLERYSPKGKLTGLAARLPHTTEPGKYYYEHGATVDEIRTEWHHKMDLYADLRNRVRESKREARRIAHAIRLCRNMVVTIDHCRRVGYCLPGINAFRQRHGISADAVRAAVLQRILPQDSRLLPVLQQAARELIASRKPAAA